MRLETHHINNRAERCVACTKRFEDRDRVAPCYVVGELRLDAPAQPEVGLLLFHEEDPARPFYRHVDCADRSLRRTPMRPSIHYCIRCQLPLGTRDFTFPVFQVINPIARNPSDPSDTGVEFGERIHFAHIDCKDAQLKRTSALVV